MFPTKPRMITIGGRIMLMVNRVAENIRSTSWDKPGLSETVFAGSSIGAILMSIRQNQIIIIIIMHNNYTY
jgi:hypothetical protein